MKRQNDTMNDVSSNDSDEENNAECNHVAENVEEELEYFDAYGRFDKTYRILYEEAVSMQYIYVLHLATYFHGKNAKVLAGLSDFQCVVYDIDDHFRLNFSHVVHEDVITDVKFARDSVDLFYTGSLDGTIKLWDMRTKLAPTITFRDDSDGPDKLKPINCFDVSCDNKFVCGGTPLVEADSYLLFWDVRKSSVLGGYWETHIDDVTQVKFNPLYANSMLSASTDGLINVFDISQSNEDDALQHSLNVETAVRKVEWCNCKDDETTIGCITDIETLQLWNIEDSQPFENFTRKVLGSGMHMKSWDNSYIADIHATNKNEITIVAGSVSNKKNYLKSLVYSNGELRPSANFIENKQLVRCSSYSKSSDTFITAGESSIISVWVADGTYNENSCLKDRVKRSKCKFT